jgi:hypothetical protein
MLAAMMTRDLTIGLRTPAVAIVAGLHAGLLAGFLMLWGSGVPRFPGENVYEQQRLVQTWLLVCLLPWAAVRCGPCDRGSDLTMLAVITASRPSRVVMAQFAALLALLGLVVSSGIPMMLVTRQVASVPLDRVLLDAAGALALAAIAAAITIAWTHVSTDRFVAWIGATVSTAAVVAMVSMLPTPTAPAVLLVVGIVLAMVCAARANTSATYLAEDPA